VQLKGGRKNVVPPARADTEGRNGQGEDLRGAHCYPNKQKKIEPDREEPKKRVGKQTGPQT